MSSGANRDSPITDKIAPETLCDVFQVQRENKVSKDLKPEKASLAQRPNPISRSLDDEGRWAFSLPSVQKKRIVEKARQRQRRGRIYLFGALVLITVVGVALYVYASSQSTPPIVYAKLSTSQGQIEVELYQNATPKTVTNFVNLAKSGFYNGLLWHRVAKGFVIQTGDPNTRNLNNNSTWGQGGSGQTVPLEIVSSLHNYAGYLAMAHSSDPNSGSSQFYINLNDTNANALDGRYTVFGKVIAGMNVALAIGNVPVYTPPDGQPINPVFLTSVTISKIP